RITCSWHLCQSSWSSGCIHAKYPHLRLACASTCSLPLPMILCLRYAIMPSCPAYTVLGITPGARVLYGVIAPEYSKVYRKHMALGLQLPTRSSLGLSPPSLTGAEAQVAFEAGSMGFSPCSGVL
ncbi:mCG144777, partial [Mus musculus]